MMYKIYLSLLLYCLIYAHTGQTQSAYAGAGFTQAIIDGTSIYTPSGVGISIFKDINFSDSKFSLINNLNTAFLYSELNQAFLPAYFASLSGSAALSYKLSLGNRFAINPFLGPFGSWVSGMKSDLILNEAETVDFFRYGFKVGLIVDIKISKNFGLRLVPWSGQYGNEYYRQGFIELAISID